jgi:hypothetical protein
MSSFFFFIISGWNIIGHENSDSNLESLCIIYEYINKSVLIVA